MAKPQDDYNPVPTVTPQTGMPSDYLSVRSSPADAGAQVGGALQQTGKVLGQMGDEAQNIALQRQGMLNETLSTDAETAAVTKYGAIMNKYKSLEGLAAVHALPDTINQLQQVRQQIGATLPNPAAKRAFDLLAVRRESFNLQDANSYGAQQIKTAANKSSLASLKVSEDSASDPSIASNDQAFGQAKGDALFSINKLMEAQGYMEGATQDPKTGEITFPDTPEGQQGRAVYQNYKNESEDRIWTNRIGTLAFDPKSGSVTKAMDTLAANKDNIPSATYARLSHQLAPAYRNEEARSGANQYVANLDQQYDAHISGSNPGGPSNPNNLGNVKGAGGGFAAPVTPQDGALLTANTLRDGYKGLTLDQIAKKWEGTSPVNINNWASNVSSATGISRDSVPNLDDPKVLSTLLKGVSVAEKSPQDRSAFTDSVISQAVNDSLAGKKASLGASASPSPAASGGYMSKADYYATNEASIEAGMRAQAQKTHQGDSAFEDSFVQHGMQQVNSVVSQQRAMDTANGHTVYNRIYDQKNPVTNEDQLMQDPSTRQAWISLNSTNPLAADNARKIITMNSQGKAVGFGSDFYRHLQDSLTGVVQKDTDLNPYITPGAGANSPITNTGFGKLQSVLQDNQTTDGHAFNAAESKYLSSLHSQFFGSGQIPGVSPTQSSREFQSVLADVIPKIEAAKAAGKTGDQIFNPNSKDYISTSIKPPDPMKLLVDNAMRNIKVGPGGQANTSPTTFNTLDDLKKSNLSRDEKVKLALSKGWISPPAPQVPLP